MAKRRCRVAWFYKGKRVSAASVRKKLRTYQFHVSRATACTHGRYNRRDGYVAVRMGD